MTVTIQVSEQEYLNLLKQDGWDWITAQGTPFLKQYAEFTLMTKEV